MIKFFRKIRYDLMEKNMPVSLAGPPAGVAGNTKKYLKYAIGEIVLVVFGILIALQINNWNVNRLNKKLVKTYLNSLIQDLNNEHLIIPIKKTIKSSSLILDGN